MYVQVERVEVKDIRLPQQLTRAMAAEAEAAREARAKVVAAEGEQKVCARAHVPMKTLYFRRRVHCARQPRS